MKIAVVLNAHGNTDVVLDTVDAIRTFVTNDILVVVDGAAWEKWGQDVKLPAYKLQGFYHNHHKAPYRNMTYGLQNALDLFPDADWYCYTEYDVLFTSAAFQLELRDADKQNVWCIGNDLRIQNLRFPYLEAIVGAPIKQSRYLLGCCVFHSGKFLRRLKSVGFFEKFLMMTNDFEKGFFPGFEEFDFGEYLYPTLAAHLGGSVGQFAYWNTFFNQWGGYFKKYPMRWQPELTWDDNFDEAAILHPLKENSELRWFHRIKRQRKYAKLQTENNRNCSEHQEQTQHSCSEAGVDRVLQDS